MLKKHKFQIWFFSNYVCVEVYLSPNLTPPSTYFYQGLIVEDCFSPNLSLITPNYPILIYFMLKKHKFQIWCYA